MGREPGKGKIVRFGNVYRSQNPGFASVCWTTSTSMPEGLRVMLMQNHDAKSRERLETALVTVLGRAFGR